jgi:hypothetical protein
LEKLAHFESSQFLFFASALRLLERARFFREVMMNENDESLTYCIVQAARGRRDGSVGRKARSAFRTDSKFLSREERNFAVVNRVIHGFCGGVLMGFGYLVGI